MSTKPKPFTKSRVREPARKVDGFLVVNKPARMTSADVVRRVKRLTNARKVGHGGTLDPNAAGVLLICLGDATRFAAAALLGTKEYTITGRIGKSTDTYDSTGRVTVTCRADEITERMLENILANFRGEIQQVPPMYSALKVRGRRLYQLARQGFEVERAARTVQVHRLNLLSWGSPDFVLDVECGRGFYARSLVHDLGLALKSAAHLVALTRTRAGPFTLENAISICELEALSDPDNLPVLLLPVDWAIRNFRAIVMDPLQQEQVQHGQSLRSSSLGVPNPYPNDGEKVRAYDRSGCLIAVLEHDSATLSWHPEKVFVAL